MWNSHLRKIQPLSGKEGEAIIIKAPEEMQESWEKHKNVLGSDMDSRTVYYLEDNNNW